MTIRDLVNVNNLVFDDKGYADVVPSLIDNTTMKVRSTDNGVTILSVRITPVPGYVLHDSFSDYPGLDPETGDQIPVLGYVRGTISIGANYDFTANPREFYAIPESDVPDPENQIFGGNNDHEVM